MSEAGTSPQRVPPLRSCSEAVGHRAAALDGSGWSARFERAPSSFRFVYLCIVAGRRRQRNCSYTPAMAVDPLVTRSEDLRRWRSQFTDTTAIASSPPRQRATCVGVVYRIRLVPGRQLEVTIEHGTQRLTGVFTGRSNLRGLELGAGLRLTGTVARNSDHGLMMLNPTWALVAELYE